MKINVKTIDTGKNKILQIIKFTVCSFSGKNKSVNYRTGKIIM